MCGSGLPLTTGEGNTAVWAEAIRVAFEYRPLEGQQLRVRADEALDALLAECGRLREQAEQWERRCEQAYERFDAASNDAMQANLKVGRLREQLDALATSLEQKVAGNKQGPDMGWTHPDEPADQLRREVGYVIEDARAALGVCPLSDRPLTGEGAAAARARAEAWLAGLVRRDMTASLATATDLARDVLALTDELEALREQLDAAAKALDECPPGSEWWYDGRDIFHRPTGTNMQQLVIPLPETWHESQRVPDSVARFVVEAANVVIRARAALGVEGPAAGDGQP